LLGQAAVFVQTKLRAFLLASRPATLFASISPVLVGEALALDLHKFILGGFVSCVLIAVLLQIGANYANDYFDFMEGADTHQRIGPPRATASGLVAPHEMFWATVIVFALAAIAALYVVIIRPLLLPVGLASIAAALLYTGGPWPYGYHGLGEVFVFLFFGIVACVGTFYVQTNTITISTFLGACAVGFMVVAILVANNIRDIPTDQAAGKRTLMVRLGDVKSRGLYAALVVLPAIIVIIGVFTSQFNLSHLLAEIYFPLALINLYKMIKGLKGKELVPVLKLTSLDTFIFAIGIMAGSIFM